MRSARSTHLGHACAAPKLLPSKQIHQHSHSVSIPALRAAPPVRPLLPWIRACFQIVTQESTVWTGKYALRSSWTRSRERPFTLFKPLIPVHPQRLSECAYLNRFAFFLLWPWQLLQATRRVKSSPIRFPPARFMWTVRKDRMPTPMLLRRAQPLLLSSPFQPQSILPILETNRVSPVPSS